MDADISGMIGFLAAAMVAMLALGFVLGRRGRDSRDLSGPPPSMTARPPVLPGTSSIAPEDRRARQGGVLQGLDPLTVAKIEAALSDKRKLDAIKLLREATGLGLREAKEAIEAIE